MELACSAIAGALYRQQPAACRLEHAALVPGINGYYGLPRDGHSDGCGGALVSVATTVTQAADAVRLAYVNADPKAGAPTLPAGNVSVVSARMMSVAALGVKCSACAPWCSLGLLFAWQHAVRGGQ
jgi:hypothetical protein